MLKLNDHDSAIFSHNDQLLIADSQLISQREFAFALEQQRFDGRGHVKARSFVGRVKSGLALTHVPSVAGDNHSLQRRGSESLQEAGGDHSLR